MIPIEIYRKEIFNFLKTLSIKFIPFANYYRTILNNCAHEVRVDDIYNKYYLNLCGQYHSSDPEIYITSIDDGTKILLSRENLLLHPKTASVYRVPNPEYDILLERFPTQKGLIKSIIYPAKDINTVVNADNFELLAYDDSLLNLNEKHSLINEIKDFLYYVNDRWYTYEFVYEDLYLPAFWSIIWQQLPWLLLVKRIKNIRTPYVHPFHIWEYLESNGLKNYSDILTNKQALWLYRNIRYIYKNKGKQSNLIKLADNLLADQHVSLVGKTIYQQQYDKFDVCMTVPEYLSEDVVSYKILQDDTNSYESVSVMNNRLFMSALEIKNDVAYTNEIEEKYAMVAQNILPTKLVEIQKNVIDTRYANLLMEFIFDTFIYRLKENNLRYKLNISDPLTNYKLSLTPGEALALFHYCAHKSIGQDPTYIPNKYLCRIAYKNKKFLKEEFPKYIYYDNSPYFLSANVNVEKVINQIPIIPGPIDNQNQFIDLCVNQFRILQHHVRQVRTNADLLYMKGMCTVYDELIVRSELDFQLTNHERYGSWFSSDEILNEVMNEYDKTLSKEEYFDKLAINILLEIAPIDDPLFREFIGITEDMDTLYQGLKNLFIQLCSYNIAFLDTSRLRTQYLFMIPIAYAKVKADYESDIDLISYFTYDIWDKNLNQIDIPVNFIYDMNKQLHGIEFKYTTSSYMIKNEDLYSRQSYIYKNVNFNVTKAIQSGHIVPMKTMNMTINEI